MRGNKSAVLTVAERCKNIIASNWIGNLNTIKADAKGSKEDIHSSKVLYMIRKGRPYIWVPEKDLHNVNTLIDERGSFAVTSPFPGPLASLFRSLDKLPARVALTGDIVPLKSEKAQDAVEKLKEVILSEQKAIKDFGYTVSSVLRSSNFKHTSRFEKLKELAEGNGKHVIYKFSIRSGMFIDCKGGMHEVDMEDLSASKVDLLAPFSAMLIDGINQSDARRRALLLFCLVYCNANARDAYIISADRKGFDVLGRVFKSNPTAIGEYEWKVFRIALKEEATSMVSFCQQLVDMEEYVVKKVSSYSGIG